MIHAPIQAAFEAAKGTEHLVWSDRTYRMDCDTPLALFARLRGLTAGPHFLLESAEGGDTWARYSFLGLGALVEVIGRPDRTTLRYGDGREEELPAGLTALRTLLDRHQPIGGTTGEERFVGGLVGYIAYDAVRYFERIPDSHADPDAELFRFVLPEVIGLFDNFRQDLRLVVFGSARDPQLDAAHEAEALCARLDRLEQTLRNDAVPLERCTRLPINRRRRDDATVSSSFTQEGYEAAVARAKEYILAGDIFQVVLSQRLSLGEVDVPPLTVYRRLRHENPSPYMFYLGFEDESLIGCSPEVMVRLSGRTCELRPIAGTRPRGQTPKEDLDNERELLADPKELAEHVMLLDLGRNDLGRVCDIGSIEIPERMVIERYSKVMHVVSHVRGALRPELDWLDLLAATFPAGTLSGAPKIRAMEIIDELEPSRRGPYGGAIGYIGFDGNMDLCITIRTLHVRDGEFVVQAGAGIVADSVPEREYEETVNKAHALLHAVGAI